MTTTEDRLAGALESAVEDLELSLEAASIEFDTFTSANSSQYVIVFAEGERLAYITAEANEDDMPVVFVDIYGVAPDGAERWICGDLSVDVAALYIAGA